MQDAMARDDLNLLLERLRDALQADDDRAVAAAVEDVHSADLAEVIPLLDDELQSKLLYQLPARVAAEVVIELDEAERGELVDDMDEATLSDIVATLSLDDAADVLSELTPEQREEVLESIPDDLSLQIEDLLGHEEDTAGGIMTPQLVSLPVGATVGEATDAVRRASEDEDIHYVYITNEDGSLFGLVPLRRLVTRSPATRLVDICERDPLVVHVGEDQERVAQVIRKYDVAAVPVVDESGKLVGRITHDDVMDVAEQEADEDIYYMAGTEASELEETSTTRAAFIRMRWLTGCLLGTTVSASILITCQRTFSEELWVALMPFVPMMGAMGGNSGIQVSTIIVRNLATGDLAATMMGKALARELRIVLVMAPLCGILAATITMVAVPILKDHGWFQAISSPSRLALAVGMGMMSAISVASLLGMLLPYMFRRIGVDPAIASGPIVTTSNDIVSYTVYFCIAYLVLV